TLPLCHFATPPSPFPLPTSHLPPPRYPPRHARTGAVLSPRGHRRPLLRSRGRHTRDRRPHHRPPLRRRPPRRRGEGVAPARPRGDQELRLLHAHEPHHHQPRPGRRPQGGAALRPAHRRRAPHVRGSDPARRRQNRRPPDLRPTPRGRSRGGGRGR